MNISTMYTASSNNFPFLIKDVEKNFQQQRFLCKRFSKATKTGTLSGGALITVWRKNFLIKKVQKHNRVAFINFVNDVLFTISYTKLK